MAHLVFFVWCDWCFAVDHSDLEADPQTDTETFACLYLCVQNKREYYEQTLMQELKKNQHLQEYVRLLESRLHQTDLQQWTRGSQVSLQHQSDQLQYVMWLFFNIFIDFFSLWKTPDISGSSDSQLVQSSSKPSLDVQSTPALPPSLGTKSSLRLASMRFEMQSDPVTEVRDLKEQLEALRCQVSSRVIKIFNVISKVEL